MTFGEISPTHQDRPTEDGVVGAVRDAYLPVELIDIGHSTAIGQDVSQIAVMSELFRRPSVRVGKQAKVWPSVVASTVVKSELMDMPAVIPGSQATNYTVYCCSIPLKERGNKLG